MAHQGNPDSYGFSDDADIILRSSDNVDFYVIGALLRHVSRVFKDMFTLSRSDNNEKKDSLPVVPVTEDSETLRFLLDVIYPYEQKPQLSSPIIAQKVSKAAQKYMMDMIESKLKRQITNSTLIAEKPLSIYAIATDLGWQEVAVNAARRTLNTPLEKLAYVDESQCITGADFYHFLEYRRLCDQSKNPQQEVFPPLRRREDSIEARSGRNSAGSDIPTEDIPFTAASEPYALSELSDLILRTPDGVDFYVFAALLRFSSPFFNRKFPLENPVMKDGLAVINVQEDSHVLRLLLSFVYPTKDPGIQSAGLYAQVVFSARRYKMTNIEDRVKKHASASSLVATEPRRVYAVASALSWTTLAKTAALNTLHTPFQELDYGDEMHLMTGAQLFRLMRFRFVCADTACGVLDTDTCKRYGLQGSVLQTLRDKKTLDIALSERLKVCPRGSTVTNSYDQGVSKGIADSADACDGSVAAIFVIFNILRCMQETPKEVEKAVLKVDLLSCLY